MSASTKTDFQFPTLETPRLILRSHQISDFADCCALWSDPVVTRHISGRAFTPEEVWARLLRYVGHWSMLGYGYWVMEEKATGNFVGELGFADYKRAIDPPLASPEAGWVLASSAHGKGFATEAISAILTWGDAHLPFDRTCCIITPENVASIRLAEKCGYRLLRNVQYKGEMVSLFERIRP
jgi:RimJ/RimL family protein N-acetyltransferase